MKPLHADQNLQTTARRGLSTFIAALLILLSGLLGSILAFESPGNAHGATEHVTPAEIVLANMLRAQENLDSFDLPATARIYVGGRNALTANIHVSASRPNYVAVRWLGMTIHPRKGLIFIDPAQFITGDYTLSIVARPETVREEEACVSLIHSPGSKERRSSDMWIVSAVSTPEAAFPLCWRLYVDPETWLIIRAEVVTSDSDTCTIEATYTHTGYRRWEPLFIRAEGRMVLQEFLPDILVGLILGPTAKGTSAYVELEFP